MHFDPISLNIDSKMKKIVVFMFLLLCVVHAPSNAALNLGSKPIFAVDKRGGGGRGGGGGFRGGGGGFRGGFLGGHVSPVHGTHGGHGHGGGRSLHTASLRSTVLGLILLLCFV
ncbi:hypothetical protein L1987_84125 [Smallanthus sonchifolius]|uniref:Uncharacterized protein n=1 Tax=Smallanthus sonchifolius TaxID=185202 RepID=A0ACB8YEZ1_9ASTR|nr:hypothetical protein L1987_84125 [Smallanthus sonchifolius]